MYSALTEYIEDRRLASKLINRVLREDTNPNSYISILDISPSYYLTEIKIFRIKVYYKLGSLR